MARSLRIEFPGALYHITSRGDGQERIYISDEDRNLFLDTLSEICLRCTWVCYAYCLMDNHYHLLIETPAGNLSKGMQLLNGVYTQKFNRIHNRVGHVFQGRFKAILVDKDIYFLELSRYIVLNPVRAKMVASPHEWKWSSYLATILKESKPNWLYVDKILCLFSEDVPSAIRKYQEFVTDGVRSKSPWSNLKKQIYLGSDEFIKEMLKKIDPQMNLIDIPKTQYKTEKYTLKQIEQKAGSRNEGILVAYKSGQFSLKEIGDYFGLHYSTVSKIVKKL
ncbi:transposase [Legionella resiliens]|uniref:Transposase n=1 Tax=Legionella resiliens TaxID=2905958 RepID=A0ABS8WX51_9GAMM|nr:MULTISPECIES: transposase [unclassified Legionella]MCE0721879.1 transposase [Legionella sp. 9fVS26]MCE3531033.1 transposase [Legionella sp. 8cVS16]